MKKYIPYVLIAALTGILVLAFFPLRNYYLFLKEPVSPLTDAIPENTALIVKTGSVEKLIKIIRASELFEILEKNKTRYGIRSIAASLDEISGKNDFFRKLALEGDAMICLVPGHEMNPEILLLLGIGKTTQESIRAYFSEVLPGNSRIEKINNKPADLYHIISGGKEIWFYVRKGILAISCNRQVAVQSCLASGQINTLTYDTVFAKLTRSSGKRVDGVLMLNNRKLVELFLQIKDRNPLDFSGSPFDGWTSLDLHIEKNKVLMDGFMSGKNENSILSNQTPGNIDQMRYFPGETAFSVTLSISNQEEYTSRFFRQDTIRLPGYDSANRTSSTEIFRRAEHLRSWIGNSVSLVALPAFFSGNDSAKMLMISLKNQDSALLQMKPFLKPYNGKIKIFTAPGLAQRLWGTFFSMGQTQYCLFTDQALILSPTAGLLTEYTVEIEENRLLGSTRLFKEATSLFIEESTLTIFMIPPVCSSYPYRNGPDRQWQTVSGWTGVPESSGLLCMQISSADPMLYTHAFALLDPEIKQLAHQFEKSDFRYPEILDNSSFTGDDPEESMEYQADAEESGGSVSNVTGIILISGDKTGNDPIFTFNKSVLTAIAPDGLKMWAFEYKGELTGDVFRIEQKGSARYLIATGTHLHIIDLKGKESKNSPVKVPAGIKGKISLFDYDHNRNYRILYAGKDNRIHNITLEGEELPDWQKPSISGRLNSLQFFRTSGKDFILLTDTKGRISIFDRRGRSRIKVKEEFSVSTGSLVFENSTNSKGLFLMASASGNLAYLDGNGNFSESRFGEHGKNPWFEYSDFNNDGVNDFIFCGEGKVAVYSRMKKEIAAISLRNANFSRPFIYKSKKVNWLAVRDLKSGKVLAFNHENKSFREASLTSECDPVITKRAGDKNPVLVTVKKGKPVFTSLK
ncbi:MAG: hypothetical protein V1775_14975 [Bacteroidota bacterium]